MVLGLIDFLLGGKRKTKVPKNAQASTAMMGKVGQANAVEAEPAGDGDAQLNASGTQEQPAVVSTGPKKSVSDMISSIHKELKNTTETVSNISSEMKEVKNTVNSLDKRVSEIEKKNTLLDEKVVDIDDNMSKFLSLYELVNDQYNPFVESKAKNAHPKEIIIDNHGGGSIIGSDNNDSNNVNEDGSMNTDIGDNSQEYFKSDNNEEGQYTSNSNNGNQSKNNVLKTSLLELDTLDIEEAAADAVPLTRLKNNTNSLVIILSWLEYFVKKVGVEETKDTLRYYTETLKWITPEVYFELEKYLRGMKDTIDESNNESINVKDHIVSLYFISKLNEKVLDERLTKAVLEIIKQ